MYEKLDLYLGLVRKAGKKPEDEDYWLFPYYLASYLKPFPFAPKDRREKDIFEGNNLTQAIAYWTGVPETIIIDRSKNLNDRSKKDG